MIKPKHRYLIINKNISTETDQSCATFCLTFMYYHNVIIIKMCHYKSHNTEREGGGGTYMLLPMFPTTLLRLNMTIIKTFHKKKRISKAV